MFSLIYHSITKFFIIFPKPQYPLGRNSGRKYTPVFLVLEQGVRLYSVLLFFITGDLAILESSDLEL